MIKIIVVIIAILLVAILAFATTKPDVFRVQRSVNIKATPDKILALISDFHRWAVWSPYEKLDPNMKKTFSGASAGKGAVYEWEGKGNAGAGRMEITDVSPGAVVIQLDFTKPMTGHNIAEFTLVPNGDSTQVTWAMHGPSAYLTKVMSVFLNMDDLIGKDFEAGLANLKGVAEAGNAGRADKSQLTHKGNL